MEVKRVYLELDDFKRIRMALRASRIFFFQGTCSMYCPAVATKWLVKNECIMWEGVYRSPGEIAKYELSRAFPGLKKIGWRGNIIKLLGHTFPMFCTDEHRGEFTYIDIVSAYWQIYGRLWLDGLWPRGLGGKLDLAPVAYRLRDCKPARNALVGIVRSTTTVGWKDGKSLVLKSKNPYLSPCLWATIQCWLNEVAFAARECGAVYWMIDGGFFPKGANISLFTDMLDYYQIDYRQKSCAGHILGWLSYDMIGHKTTSYYSKGARGRVSNVTCYLGYQNPMLDFWRNDVINWRLRG